MSIEMDKFWDGKPINPPLTDEKAKEAEKTFKVVLPKLYVKLLKIQNGGRTKGFVFPTTKATSWAEDHVCVSDMRGIADFGTILNNIYLWLGRDRQPKKQIPICGDIHAFISLDYRRGKVPSVAWIDLEAGQDVEIAASFDAFFKHLLPEALIDADTNTLKKR